MLIQMPAAEEPRAFFVKLANKKMPGKCIKAGQLKGFIRTQDDRIYHFTV